LKYDKAGGAIGGDVTVSGSVLAVSPTGVGYGVGAGGTVTQTTSKSTAVTLNKACGLVITSNSSLAAGQTTDFHIATTSFSLGDTATVVLESAGGVFLPNYRVGILGVEPGQLIVYITNISGGALGEVMRIYFQVHKGSVS
jgi:hypothetical protein